MGWTFCHRDKGLSTEEFFIREGLGRENGQQLLGTAVAGGGFYAAIRNADDAPYMPGQVWCFVAAIQWAGGYHNFGYKDLDENWGPNEATCPARILDLLSPLPECSHPETYCAHCGSRIWQFGDQWVSVANEHQVPEAGGPVCRFGSISADGLHEPGGTPPCSTCIARDWRERCRAHIAKVAASKTVKAGMTVKFAREFEFGGGVIKASTFEFIQRDTFWVPGLCRVSIPGWRTMEFEIISAEPRRAAQHVTASC